MVSGRVSGNCFVFYPLQQAVQAAQQVQQAVQMAQNSANPQQLQQAQQQLGFDFLPRRISIAIGAIMVISVGWG